MPVHHFFFCKSDLIDFISKIPLFVLETNQPGPVVSTSVSEDQNPEKEQQTQDKVRPSPAQEEAQKCITLIQGDLTSIQLKLDSNLSPNPTALFLLKKRKLEDLKKAEQRLKSLKGGAVRQAKYRGERKRKIQELQELHPEGPQVFKQSKPGRPRLEESQPGKNFD